MVSVSEREKPKLVVDLTCLHTPGGARGIGRYARELARGLSELPASEREGIDLVALTWLGWNGEHTVTRDLGAFDDPRLAAPPSGTDYYVWAYRQRFAFFRAARRLGAHTVHICDPHATPLLLRPFGIRKIVTCHDLVPTRFPDHYMSIKDGGSMIGKMIEARRYRSADLVIAVSDATRNDVRTLLGVPNHRVVRVYNGVDVARWAAPPVLERELVLRQLDLPETPFALYVGGSDWRKNVEGMAGALVKARASGTPLTLIWAGNLEPAHRERVDLVLRSAGVAELVRFTGFVTDDQLAVLYRAAVAHLFVSRLEGFGLTVVEAMASGCPVVTTRGGSLAEVAGDAAIAVDPEDHDAIARALVSLVDNPQAGRELAERGRARAPRFSRAAQARATIAAYHLALGSRHLVSGIGSR
jgi:glycosyltransferase involved in cell wall biosynthesis